MMWRIAAVALLAGAGCAGSPPVQRPDWVPNTDLFFQKTEAFFSGEKGDDHLLPASTGDKPPGTAR
jgi:hypothetical protein